MPVQKILETYWRHHVFYKQLLLIDVAACELVQDYLKLTN